ncbi:Histone-lysine N-methyltransferase, H3 lysine-36 and H4 lysine-20 specific [Amphibalanus amphitrite]|uniref:Histone-lysine N-methyltransferase, H3 lysine-36 and H4 lysine-20 specific n=1 Tax=Amphibalanus amphitrite TaxID=1232801 RepID=A0A6A4W6C0_AMPAM|nr:Histone-lysine N-methyltransferase, H3 lysine-36 and H4 lysine-20 specific [Amphibalanus amphitrite]
MKHSKKSEVLSPIPAKSCINSVSRAPSVARTVDSVAIPAAEGGAPQKVAPDLPGSKSTVPPSHADDSDKENGMAASPEPSASGQTPAVGPHSCDTAASAGPTEQAAHRPAPAGLPSPANGQPPAGLPSPAGGQPPAATGPCSPAGPGAVRLSPVSKYGRVRRARSDAAYVSTDRTYAALTGQQLAPARLPAPAGGGARRRAAELRRTLSATADDGGAITTPAAAAAELRPVPDSAVPCEYVVGDVVWARVSGYPLWPAIVVYDTASGQFSRLVRKAGSRGPSVSRRYHVRFFGDLCRGWIAPINLRRFEGRAQFDQLARAEQLGGKRSGREGGQFRLSNRNLPKWLEGVAEATGSLALDRYERVKPFVESNPPAAETKPETAPAPAPKPKQRRRASAPAAGAASSGSSRASSGSSRASSAAAEAPAAGARSEAGSRCSGSASPSPSAAGASSPDDWTDEAGFSQFCESQREGTAARRPELAEVEVIELLAARWEAMGRAERAAFAAAPPKKAAARGSRPPAAPRAESSDADADSETSGRSRVRRVEKVCQLCEVNGELGRDVVRCAGSCGGVYHLRCAGAPASTVQFTCAECLSGRHACFVCRSPAGLLEPCRAAGRCGKRFHRACLRLFPQATTHEERLVCPLHVCHTCVSEDPRRLAAQFKPTDKLFKCVRCPTTYHTSEQCVAAGTEILNSSQIVCTKHYTADAATKKMASQHHINTTWCFICSKGGSLICCESCPASFHAECVNTPVPEGGYVCEECESGRFPLYGEVVWVKHGFYRWWPAMVVPPNDIPENLLQMDYSTGQFVVRFFGSNDYSWVRRGRVFLFEEGDSLGKVNANGSKTLTSSYKKALQEATAYYQQYREHRRREKEGVDILRPPSYIKIKTNKPVGGVKLSNGDVSQATACGCRPTDERPCGPDSSCLNRMLMLECHPELCRAGDRCLNQRFQKRLYPQLQVVRTANKGWGLATCVDLKKGDFVIEYVGEVISELELHRRVELKHRTQDDNYYFLTIDRDRVLDAGPKGNMARFMNHCCQPNCETQKWTINSETRVGLFTLTDIPAGTELNFNYNFDCVGTAKKRCMCGADNCSGFLGDKVLKAVKAAKADDKARPLKRRRRRRTVKRRSEDRAVQLCSLCPNSVCRNHQDTGIARHAHLGHVCQDHSAAEVAQAEADARRREESAPAADAAPPPRKRRPSSDDGGAAKRPHTAAEPGRADEPPAPQS